MNLAEVELAKVCLSQIRNLRTICKDIDCRVHAFQLQYPEFPLTTSNGVILETKTFFSIFNCVSEMYIKFRTFWKKDEPSSLSMV